MAIGIISALLIPCSTTFADSIPTCTLGLCTIKNLLATAMQPVCSTMYIWGGGWNEEDTGAGKTSTSIGVSPHWKEFYEKQNANYNFREYRKEIGNLYLPLPEYIGYGLDCSGFVGWTVYNTVAGKVNSKGFVCKAKTMAKVYAEKYKFGKYTDFGKITSVKPGDIISICTEKIASHVYIALGQCEDGSILTIESSPPGVRLRGTKNYEGSFESQAVALAQKYISKYYPEWHKKFPDCVFRLDDYRQDSQMSWEISETSIMKDPDGYRNMTPKEVLKDLFNEN